MYGKHAITVSPHQTTESPKESVTARSQQTLLDQNFKHIVVKRAALMFHTNGKIEIILTSYM